MRERLGEREIFNLASRRETAKHFQDIHGQGTVPRPVNYRKKAGRDAGPARTA